MKRKLATIRQIGSLKPISGADKIELAQIDGWQVVVKKGEFKEGDLCIYCEIDSVLPELPCFEFLRERKYRIKTVELRGQISQGIAFPMSLLAEEYFNVSNKIFVLGADLTDTLGVKKYEIDIPAGLQDMIRGAFPALCPQTDEKRIQNLVNELDQWKKDDVRFIVTEKLNGVSATYMILDGEFHVCSKELSLLDKKNSDIQCNTYWNIAKEYDMENVLREILRNRKTKNIALQGEIVGEGIQKNRYKLIGQHFYTFNLFDIDNQKYVDSFILDSIKRIFKIQTVPVLHEDFSLENLSVRNLLDIAQGDSLINPNVKREGLVFKRFCESGHGKISFKVLSNKYLLKND